MASMNRRIARLETSKPESPEPSASALEVRAIDAEIRRLDEEIAAAETSMTPTEIAASRAKDAEFMASLDGLTTDEKIAALDKEIARVEGEE